MLTVGVPNIGILSSEPRRNLNVARRRRRNKGPAWRNRPNLSRRGPGPVERMVRGLPEPSDDKPDSKTTIYASANKPVELRDDADLTLEVRDIPEPISELRKRGLPYWLACQFYDTTKRLMQDPELTVGGQKQLAQAVNLVAKVDIETARFQAGEAAATQVNVGVQVNPADMMKQYLNEVQDRISAAYPEPPQIEEAQFSSIQPVQFSDQADEIAEAIKAEVPALKGMNGALSKIVKKVIDQKKDKSSPPQD